ncbi:MAG: glycine--tRNA ligase [Ilumatobacteraceae bacterium]
MSDAVVRPTMEAIVNLAKRRGFVFPSQELYGGLGGFYDFGPLGVQLKRNIEAMWWKTFVQERGDVVGIESAIIGRSELWRASGHLEYFTDPLVECKVCHERFRADKPEELAAHPHQGQFTDPRAFQQMFKTFVGLTEAEENTAYLRPETAQGMFTNFENIVSTMRMRLPFGIAQIGKSFRNEITFRNFLFRMREFTIAELEYFVKPDTGDQVFEEWLAFMERVLTERFGLSPENLRRYEHPKDTLAHYSRRTVDIHYHFPWGWDELWGIAYRTDFDLAQHEKASGKQLRYRDPETNETYLPHVIEPTGGIERLFLAIMLEAYTVIEGGRTTTTEANKDEEVVLKLPKALAPVQVAILPLSKKEALLGLTQEVEALVRPQFTVDVDAAGSIGRRYRRQDEVGTPYCVTVDFDSVEDKQVTVRDRDTMAQERIPIASLRQWLTERFA